MTIRHNWNGDTLQKVFDDGTMMELGLSKLSSAMQDKLMRYAFQKKLQDVHSGEKSVAGRKRLTQEMYDAFLADRWTLAGGRSGVLDEIDWEALADAVASTLPAELQSAGRDSVIAKSAMIDGTPAEKRKLTALVKSMFARSAIVEAYGSNPFGEPDLSDLLDL